MIEFENNKGYKFFLTNGFIYKGFVKSCELGLVCVVDEKTGNEIYFKEASIFVIEKLGGVN